ncbi:MAG: hypothetical protein HY927_11315 [Elusimicrobia bacterium]|nr:hypothetical protein [Elusimicrobiota bacterium]
MKTRGTMGWVFLVAVLLVPALMYYRTYYMKEHKRQMEEKLKRRAPPGGVFPEAADVAKLSNPIAAGMGTTVAQTPGSEPVQVGTAAASALAQAVVDPTNPAGTAPQAQAQPSAAPGAGTTAAAPTPPGPGAQPPAAAAPSPASSETPSLAQAAPAAGAQPAEAAPAVPAPGAAAPSAEVAGSTVNLLAMEWRDPMMSPYDQFLMDQEDLQKMMKRREVEQRAQEARAVQSRPVESTVNLQGIVSMPEGNKAIVNGDMVGEGEMVGQTQIKVVKITQQSVTFLHQGKRFSKKIQ